MAAIVRFLLILSFVYNMDTLETSKITFGYALPTQSYRNISGISMKSCQDACISRKSCKAVQFMQRSQLCMLFEADGLNFTAERNPNYAMSEKRTWTQISSSSSCDSCSSNEMCESTGVSYLCKIQECQNSPYTGSGNLHGNMRTVGSRTVSKRSCYSISAGTMAPSPIQYTCLTNGTWERSEYDCFNSYNDFINYMGCYRDRYDRVLSHLSTDLGPMTIEKCAVYCNLQHYTYFGTEKGLQCYCGNSIKDHGPIDGCTFPCAGDDSLMCGGHWSLQLYSYINV